MKFELIGKKIGMTQIYDENNNLVPVTVVEATPCPITKVKTTETDGYNAVQIAYAPTTEKRVSKPVAGQLKKAGVPMHKNLVEFRTDELDSFKVGEAITVANFEAGQKVDVIANTKGRGFQGVVKRWNMAGGPASHGSMFHRRGGSFGQCQWPGEIDKGRKMPGHMGDKRRTTQNLRVIKVIEDKNLLLIKGSIAGSNGAYVTIRTAKKQKKSA